ncbi:MAG: amidohydrolase family protein [Phycisphaerae bacterium]
MIRSGLTSILMLVVMSTTPIAWADDAPAILLKAGKIYISPEKTIENGAILIEAGTITGVGTDLAPPEGATIIELPDGTITAGLIDANSTAGYRSVNKAEHRSECIPELRVIDMVDLHSRSFDRLASTGVTTVYVSADSASVIGGRGAILRTGGPAGGRIIREAYGVKATIGREPIYKASRNRTPFGRTTFLTRRPNTRMGLAWVFRKSFHDAQIFARGETPATRGEGSPSDDSIPTLIGVLKGEIPLRIQARSHLDILTAIRLSREFNIPFTLEEGTDAYRCLDDLRENKIPIIYGPIFDYPHGFRAGSGEADKQRYNTLVKLIGAGLTVALSANDQTGEAALPHQATYAMRFGLSRSQALAAVTTTPAKLLELESPSGTIETGQPADVVLWSGEPFAATTRAEVVVIGGTIVRNATGG